MCSEWWDHMFPSMGLTNGHTVNKHGWYMATSSHTKAQKWKPTYRYYMTSHSVTSRAQLGSGKRELEAYSFTAACHQSDILLFWDIMYNQFIALKELRTHLRSDDWLHIWRWSRPNVTFIDIVWHTTVVVALSWWLENNILSICWGLW